MDSTPDIKALITLTGRARVGSGYRPAHLIGTYLTTGVHQYIGRDELKMGETLEGTITFISPEYYPHSLGVGTKIVFQEGSQVIGYACVLEIYNEILLMRE